MQHSPLRDKVIARVNELTDQFLETGMFQWNNVDDTDPNVTWSQRYKRRTPLVGQESSARKYMRQVARELKRPFVIVDTTPRSEYTPGVGWKPDPKFFAEIRIPTPQYTAPLRSALLLVAHPVSRAFSYITPPVPVGVRHECKASIFYFYGEDGQHVFDKFMEQCKTDVKFRRALRLPLTP